MEILIFNNTINIKLKNKIFTKSFVDLITPIWLSCFTLLQNKQTDSTIRRTNTNKQAVRLEGRK